MLKVKSGPRSGVKPAKKSRTAKGGQTMVRSLRGQHAPAAVVAAQDDIYAAMLDEMDARIADIAARTDRLIARQR